MEFTYHNPTAIEFGKGQIKAITKYIKKDQKVLLVYGGGSIKNNGVYEQTRSALKEYTVIDFGGIEPNPTVETLNKAVKIIKEQKIDFVLAVGGGSVIDGCKYLIAAALYEGDAWDFLDGSAEVTKALPLGAILTLPATGSESNAASVISKKETNEKRFFHSPYSYPKFAILDASVMSSLSDTQLANGLVDAFIHTCEQYLTLTNTSLLHDGYAQTILKGLRALGETWDKRRDESWQENLMLLANQALNGFIGTGVAQDWATHMIGHELTAFYGLDHAKSLAVVQPSLLRVMIEDKKDKLSLMGKEVFGISNDNEAVIKAIENLYETVGISTKLKTYDIDDKVVSNIISALELHGMTALGENENITLDKSKEILELALA